MSSSPEVMHTAKATGTSPPRRDPGNVGAAMSSSPRKARSGDENVATPFAANAITATVAR